MKWKVMGHSLEKKKGKWYALGREFNTEGEAIKAIRDCVKVCNSCA